LKKKRIEDKECTQSERGEKNTPEFTCFVRKILKKPGCSTLLFCACYILRAAGEGAMESKKNPMCKQKKIVLLPKRTSRRSHVKRHYARTWDRSANILQLDIVSRFEYEGRLDIAATGGSVH
jgi:hypothetical protein